VWDLHFGGRWSLQHTMLWDGRISHVEEFILYPAGLKPETLMLRKSLITFMPFLIALYY